MKFYKTSEEYLKALKQIKKAKKAKDKAKQAKDKIKRLAKAEKLSKSDKIQDRFKALRLDPVHGLRQLPYKDFLQSEYWKIVRAYKLELSGYKCSKCGSKENLNVHHLTYANHGREHLHLEDLSVLCKDCHTKEHETELRTKSEMEAQTSFQLRLLGNSGL